MILVTGAAGKTGNAVIRAVLTKGLRVRALVHREGQVEATKGLGAEEIIVGDMRSSNTLTNAVKDVKAIYHICPNVNPDEVAIGRSLIDVAQAADVERFVFHSVLHPQAEEMPHHWNKMRVEEALIESGLQFTILQPAAYMQNILAEWKSIMERGIYSVPYSTDAPMSLIDLEDVAQIAANVLSEPNHSGAIYEIAGPEVLTPRQVAFVLESETGRKVRAERAAVEAWMLKAKKVGLSGYQIQTLVKMFEYYDRHGLWGNPRIASVLLNRSPTQFSDFVKRIVHERVREQ
jgi:uncharacterized protein YbjT (DUF2867 family)